MEDAQNAARIAVIVAVGVAVVAISAAAGIVLSARSDRNRVHGLVTRFSSDSYADFVAGVLGRFVGDVQQVGGNPQAFMTVGASSLLIWTLDVVTAILVFVAFDTGLELPTLVTVSFFAVSVGNLAKVIPGPPNILGLYEAAFVLIVIGITPVPPYIAIGVAVVDHFVKNAVTIVGGVISMLALNVSLTTAVEEAEEIDEETVEEPAVQ